MTPTPRSLDALQLVARYGLGTVLALFLVYKFAGEWDVELHAIATQLTTHIGTAQADQRATERLLVRICVNTAKTDRDAALCQPESQR